MAFVAPPMLPGDLFDAASRLAASAGARLAATHDAKARSELLVVLWNEVAELGWPALTVPEEAGGVGGRLADIAALAEGAARSALLLPVSSVCGIVPLLLAAAGEAGIPVLRGIAEGRYRVASAIASVHTQSGCASARAGRSDGMLRLSGCLAGVETLPDATHYVVACEVEGEAGLVLLPQNCQSLALRHYERIDARATVDLCLDGVDLPEDALLAQGRAVEIAIGRTVEAGALLVCVEAVGAMGALLEQTIAYLLDRIQFGEPLASLQVLRHRTVDLYVALESARAMIAHLVDRASSGTNWPSRELALAKQHMGQASRRFAASTIQLHGGMGMTDELPSSRLAKRLLMVEFEYGDAAHHEALLLGDLTP